MNKLFILPCVLSVIAGSAVSANAIAPNNNTEVSAEINSETTLEGTSYVKNDKQEVWHKMLNSIDYYDTVKGNFIYDDCYSEYAVNVSFESDLNNGNAVTNVMSVDVQNPDDVTGKNNIHYDELPSFNKTLTSDTKTLLLIDDVAKTYRVDFGDSVTREAAEDIPDEKRYGADEDGIMCYWYRSDPTNTFMARDCLFPQEYVFGFMNDFDLWEIKGNEEVAERECVVIEGTTEKDYGKKVNTHDFTFYVDEETGTILKMLCYDENGEVTRYLTTENIEFNAEIAEVVHPDVSGYELIQIP